ncbi:MAG: hypothetical protein JST65_17390 [Acidobacteria bacterium]|nr:hypothetical protein [Acidobacteriota bacterium]
MVRRWATRRCHGEFRQKPGPRRTAWAG